MSHFSVLVLTPEPTTREDAEAAVAPLLAPYDENLEVQTHVVECWCVGMAACQAAREAAAQQLDFEARLEHGREVWHELSRDYVAAHHGETQAPLGVEGWCFDAIVDSGVRAALQHRYDEQSASWNALFSEYDELVKRLTREHAEYGKPASDCEECAGSGRHETTANEQGYWDWYSVGGRWTGVLDNDYEPDMDPRNMRRCTYCQDGKRYWRTEQTVSEPEGLGAVLSTERDGVWSRPVATTAEDPLGEAKTCNACKGTQVVTEWPTQWVAFEGDVVALGDLIADRDGDWNTCFRALITPDGQWHARGRIGWFGTSVDDMTEETWEAYVRDVATLALERHPHASAVVVDCHI